MDNSAGSGLERKSSWQGVTMDNDNSDGVGVEEEMGPRSALAPTTVPVTSVCGPYFLG